MVEIIDRGTPLQAFFNVALFILLLYLSYKGYKKNRNNQLVVFLGILLFSIFSFWGPDYFHYKEIFDYYKITPDLYHLEEVYGYILQYSPTYFVYRLIIWGGAFILLWFASRRLGIDRHTFLFMMVALYLLRFSYARVTLSICMMVFGYSFLIKPLKSKVFSIILGIAIIGVSLYFHKSAIIIAMAIPLSFMRINKVTAVMALVLLPFAVYFASLYLYDYIISNEMISDENTLNAFNLYTQNKVGFRKVGLAQTIYTYGEMIPVYLFTVLGFYYFPYKRKFEDVIAHRMFNLFFWAVFIATVFAFITPIIHRRMLFLTLAPMVLTISKAYEDLRTLKNVRITVYSGILVQLFILLYSFYLSLHM